MKYIKLYEEINFWNVKSLKKFIVITDDTFDDYNKRYKYYIIKNLGLQYVGSIMLHVKFKYKYDDEHNYESINSEYQLNINNLNILYQSDKLKDCIEYLHLMSKGEKYNL